MDDDVRREDVREAVLNLFSGKSSRSDVESKWKVFGGAHEICVWLGNSNEARVGEFVDAFNAASTDVAITEVRRCDRGGCDVTLSNRGGRIVRRFYEEDYQPWGSLIVIGGKNESYEAKCLI